MNTTRRVPDLYVEQLVAGELGESRAAEVRAALEAEPGGLARLAAVEASDAEILSAIPADRVAREVRARTAERAVASSNVPRWAFVLPLVAVAAGALFVVRPTASPLPGDFSDQGIRTKGLEAGLVLYREGDGGPLPTDAEVSDGDLLQVAYVAGQARHGVIFSVDGRGTVTLHHPATPAGSTALSEVGETPLAHSYELDDAPAHETFVFLASDAPIDVATVLESARSNGLDGPFVDLTGATLDPLVKRLAKEEDW